MADLKVNTNSYYDELQILKVWDAYVISKQLHYWISDSEKKNSLFQEMKLLKEAGILLQNDEHLYLNSEGRTFSICGPVDNKSVAEINNFNGITHDLEVALTQMKSLIFKPNQAVKHTIMFPYHITELHWVLGVFDIDFDQAGNLKVLLQIYNSLDYGGSEIKSNVQDKITDLVMKIFEKEVQPINITFAVDAKLTSQQNDGSSCGVISAENGKGIIDDGKTSNKMIQKYAKGAEEVRKQHIKEVECSRFEEIQHRNISYNPQFVLKEEYFNNVVIELNNFPHYVIQEFNEKTEKIEFALFLKSKLKEVEYQNENFCKLLMKDNLKDEFKDDAIDTFWEAKLYLERFRRWNEEFEAKNSETDPNNNANICAFGDDVFKTIDIDSGKRKYPGNPGSFKELIDKDVFVDKTLFIRDVLQGGIDNFLFTRPRRWGKTLNMDMLKTFLEIEVDKNGKEKMIKRNPSLFIKTGNKGSPMKIYTDCSFDTCLIASFLMESSENNFEYKIDRSNLQQILELISIFNKGNDEEWAKIQKNIMNKVKTDKDFTHNELNDLEKLGEKLIGKMINDFKALHPLVSETRDLNKEKFNMKAYEKLTNTINETIMNWKESKKEAFDFMKTYFSLWSNYMGKYPVIFITFSKIQNDENKKNENSCDIYIECSYSQIKKSLSDAYKSHLYLYRKLLMKCIESFRSFVALDCQIENYTNDELVNYLEMLISRYNVDFKNNSLTYSNLKKIQRLCFDDGQKATNTDLFDSIKFLSELLYEHFNQKAFVLIDEYDSPMNDVMRYTQDSLRDIARFLGHIFRNGLKNNNNVFKAIITGILRIAKVELFSNLNNFFEYGVQLDKYAEHFGFTEEEVSDLLNNTLNCSDPTKKQMQKDAIRSWYNGYLIGNTCIYNPWSIVFCLEAGKTGAYWVNTGDPTILELEFQKIQDDREEMKNFETFMRVGYYENNGKMETSLDLHSFSQKKIYNFWPLMLLSGYLTRDKTFDNRYRIPNKEVAQQIYKRLWKLWFIKKYPCISMDDLFKEYASAMEDREKLESFFQTRILDKMEAGEKTEADFQVLFCGLGSLAALYGFIEYRILAEVQVMWKQKQIGRIDGLALPTIPNPVFIKEFKLQKLKSEDKSKIADKALWQIYATRYLQNVLKLYDAHKINQQWTHIVTRGIAFFKNQVNDKWSIMIKEYRHSFEMARKLDRLFLSYERRNNLITNREENNQTKVSLERKKFLESKGFFNLNEFLLDYSLKDKNEKLKESLETNQDAEEKNPKKRKCELDTSIERKKKQKK